MATSAARRAPAVPSNKLCPACQQWKSSADFLRISKNVDGLAHKCKPCAMKAVDGPTLEEKACSKCKEIKPKSQFCINKYMQDGMQVLVIIHLNSSARGPWLLAAALCGQVPRSLCRVSAKLAPRLAARKWTDHKLTIKSASYAASTDRPSSSTRCSAEWVWDPSYLVPALLDVPVLCVLYRTSEIRTGCTCTAKFAAKER